MKRLTKIFIYFFLITTVIVAVGSFVNDNQTDKKELVSNFNFKRLPLEKVGLPSQNRAIQRLVIETDSIISKQNLQNFSVKYWKDNSLNNYTEFTLFIYLSDMNTNQSAYCLAEFNKDGVLNRFSINKTSLLGTKWDKKNYKN